MKRIFFIFLLFFTGCATLAWAKCREGNIKKSEGVPILLYHHIQDVSPSAKGAVCRWSLSPQKFADQMDWIAEQGFSVITMSQLNDHLRHNVPLPVQPIILTFDDGWKDHYTVVVPILLRHHFTATFFVTTGSVGHSAFVTWEDLKDISALGMDIQAHSLTHPKLNKISEAQAYHEISESKKEIESRLGKPVRVFAYPFGQYTEKILDMVKAAGYESAAIVSGSNIGYLYRADQSYTLSRIAVEGDSTLQGLSQRIKEIQAHHASY